jgi:hypothetical protein
MLFCLRPKFASLLFLGVLLNLAEAKEWLEKVFRQRQD